MNIPARLLPLLLAALTLPVSQMVFQGCMIPSFPDPNQKVRWPGTTRLHAYLDGQSMGFSPASARLDRRRAHQIRIEMADYKPIEIAVPVPWEKLPAEHATREGDVIVQIFVDPETHVVSRCDIVRKAPARGQENAVNYQDGLWVKCVAAKYLKDPIVIGRLERQ